MTTHDQIRALLEDLRHAFPNQKISEGRLQVYFEPLSDIQPCWLEKWAKNPIENANWFPHLSEMHGEARRIVGPHRRLENFQQILEEESRVGIGRAELPYKQYP